MVAAELLYWLNSMNIIYRRNNKFIINKNYIKSGVNQEQICTALYAEIYLEFRGASKHQNYATMSNIEKFEMLNIFAKDWLKKRGYYNETEE